MYIVMLFAGLLFMNQLCFAKHSGSEIKNKYKSLVHRAKNRVHNVHNGLAFIDYSKPNLRDIQLTRGPGSAILNAPTGPTGAVLTLQGDVTITENVVFQGTTAINGNGNVLILGTGGSLQIDPGSSLTFKNLVIKGIGNGNIFCADDTGELIMQGVQWIQDSNYTLSQGAIAVTSNIDLIGNGYQFEYTSDQPISIDSGATMTVNYGCTFRYNPLSAANNLLQFADQSANFYLNGGTLSVGAGGLQLTTGLFFVEYESFLQADEGPGIMLGDGTSLDDLECVFGTGAILNLTSGALSYNNINASSWSMRDPNATLEFQSGTYFYVNQVINLGPGTVLASTSAHLVDSGNINGNISFF